MTVKFNKAKKNHVRLWDYLLALAVALKHAVALNTDYVVLDHDFNLITNKGEQVPLMQKKLWKS